MLTSTTFSPYLASQRERERYKRTKDHLSRLADRPLAHTARRSAHELLPQVLHSTEVNVIGTGFGVALDLSAVRCRFGSHIVNAVLYNATLIKCQSPARAVSAVVPLEVCIGQVSQGDMRADWC